MKILLYVKLALICGGILLVTLSTIVWAQPMTSETVRVYERLSVLETKVDAMGEQHKILGGILIADLLATVGIFRKVRNGNGNR